MLDSSALPSDRTSSSGHEVKHKKFYLSKRKNFFTLRVAEHWNRLSREVVESLSGSIQNPPGRLPVSPARGDPAWAGGLDWMISRGRFQPSQFCDPRPAVAGPPAPAGLGRSLDGWVAVPRAAWRSLSAGKVRKGLFAGKKRDLVYMPAFC